MSTRQIHDLGGNSSSSSSSSFVVNGSGEGSDDNDGMSGIVYYDSSDENINEGDDTLGYEVDIVVICTYYFNRSIWNR